MQKQLLEKNLDALILLTEEGIYWENLYYFSGFRGTNGALLITSDSVELFTDQRYTLQASQQTPFEVRDQGNEDLLSVILKALKKQNCRRIGYEGDHLTQATFSRLAQPPFEWVEVSDLSRTLRRAKDSTELELIYKASQLASQAFRATLEQTHIGMTEKQFAALLEFHLQEMGAEGGWGSHKFIVASGPRSALPHGEPTIRTFEAGEWATVDFGARYEGYVSDITRNIAFSKIDSQLADWHALLLEVHKKIVPFLLPGKDSGEIDEIAREFLAGFGVKDLFMHSLGHGIGLEIHESPYLSGRHRSPLASKDIVTVEPGLYKEGIGGVRLEDDYLVQEEGAERLTKDLPQEIFLVC